MGMSVTPTSEGGEDEPMSEMNVIPLIDVMLVLLIMLIVALPAQTHAVKLDMAQPQDNPPPLLEEPRVISVDVDFDGAYYWNGEMISRSVMENRFRSLAAEASPPEIHIRPHRLAEYAYVAGVMASAQREGLTKIGVIGGN